MDKHSVRNSIFTRLIFFFLFFCAIVTIGFYLSYLGVEQKNSALLEKKSDLILKLLRESVSLPQQRRKQFFLDRGYSFEPVITKNTHKLKPAFKTVPNSFSPEIKNSIHKKLIQIMRSKDTLYVLINRKKSPFMVGVKQYTPYLMWLWVGFLILILLIISFFISLIHSLLPLKQLAFAIKQYGKNGTYTPTKNRKKDEIAYVANAFDEAVRKNRALIEARHLFMRNVMHELKTPITAGRLSLPFLQKGKESEILERAFIRMELLIEEMAHIERVTSESDKIQYQSCLLTRLVDDATSLLLVKEGTVIKEFTEQVSIFADCKMMTTVFKNLIDNAFKYSDNKLVKIRYMDKKLTFINQGKPWPEEQHFETMLKPFMRNYVGKVANSLGLGLYIVKAILEKHNIIFSHYYQNNKHHFVLDNINSKKS